MRTTLTHTGAKALVSKDALRPAMQGVQFQAEHARLIATDGHKLVVFPVEVEEGDTSAVLPVDAFNTRGVVDRGEQAKITVNGNVTVEGSKGKITFETIDEQFPNWLACWPEGQPLIEIGLNLDLVCEVAKALPRGERTVKLSIRGASKAIEFQQTRSEGEPVKGLIMPVMLLD